MTVTLYQVGGSVRDELLGLKSKDIDFAVETGSFAEMRNWLAKNGFEIFLEQIQYLTIRARFPKDGFEFAGVEMSGVTADFVVCRTEAHYSDQRRPDAVDIGTIEDDLARRDFTMNAIAKRADGTYIDPHLGRFAIRDRRISTVGDPEERFEEDPLRVLRALRFSITKGFSLSDRVATVIRDGMFNDDIVYSVSEERIREELFRMLKFNSYETMHALLVRFPSLGRRILRDTSIWLKPTLEEK